MTLLHKSFLNVTYVTYVHKKAQQLFTETYDMEINTYWQSMSSKILLMEDHVLPLHK